MSKRFWLSMAAIVLAVAAGIYYYRSDVAAEAPTLNTAEVTQGDIVATVEATGTLEAATLRQAWGGMPLPPIVTPKAVLGEYGGGLVASAVAAIEGASFGRLSAFEQRDAALEVAPHDGREIPIPRRVLVSALAAGGAAAWALLERP